MLLSLVERHQDLVESWTVISFDRAGPNLRLKARVVFCDGSTLFIRQIVLGESTFKYAYHWQGRQGELVCRWDNSPHWPELATFPHHKHVVVAGSIVVQESRGGDLEEVFAEIAARFRNR